MAKGMATANVVRLKFFVSASWQRESGWRLGGDDTTVPVLAKGKTATGRLWTHVRDDRPFGGVDPPAAVFFYSRDRTAEHPERHLAHDAGVLQAGAYPATTAFYAPERSPGAACWRHGGRRFFVMADIAANARERARGKNSVIVPFAPEAISNRSCDASVYQNILPRNVASAF